jgi:hypothetical protein
LTPGAYFVSAVPAAEPGPRGETVFSGSALYYPNASSVTEAARVRVDWDQVQENIDIELGPPANTRVDGIVRFADGAGDCENCVGQIHRKEGDAWVHLSHATISRGGAFSVSGLSPGHYAFAVQGFVRRTSSASFGVVELDVLDGQATPVVVDLQGEQKVSGRIVLEDPPETVVGPEAEPWRAVIQFRQRFGDPLTAPNGRGSFANVPVEGAETQFELTAVPGRQGLHFMGAPAGGYGREISIDGRPLEGADITVPAGGIENLVVSVAFDAGKVAGRVDGGGGATVDAGLLPPARIVWLIAEGGHARFAEDRIRRSTQPDGSFELEGLPPGAYRAYAVSDETGGRMDDAAIAEKLDRWSKRIEVRAGQTTNVTLELAPPVTAPD